MRALVTLAGIMVVTPLLAQSAEQAVEQISLGASLVMLGFLLIAALIVVSFFCKLLVVFNLVPKKGRLREAIFWTARAASGTRLTTGRDNRGSSSGKGGGGSFGGSGSTGNW